MRNPNGSNIPAARHDIEVMIDELIRIGDPQGLVPRLTMILSKLHRAKPVGGRAEHTHRGWSDRYLKADIAAYIQAHPGCTRQQASIACNTNTARVSEFTAGLV